jgi:hypothetical protein
MDSMPGANETPSAAVPGNRVAIAGLVFSGLYAASFLAVRGLPRATWSDEEILTCYNSADVDYLKLVTLYLVPFAGIAFLWFLAAFRERVVRLAGTEHSMLSTVQILSGAIYVTMQFAARRQPRHRCGHPRQRRSDRNRRRGRSALPRDGRHHPRRDHLILTVADVRAVSLIFPLWIGISSILILTRHERQLTGHEA